MAKDNEVDLSGISASEIPRYRLTEAAYIDDKLLEKDSEISYAHPPGWHMHPLNKAAEAMVKKYHPQPYSVVDELTKIGGRGNGP